MDKQELLQKKCRACEGGVDPMTPEEIATYQQTTPQWNVSEDHKWISREFSFKDFMEALTFINQVAKIAEDEGHHPDIHLERYKHVRIELNTHAIDGLSENDFICAAKIDVLVAE